MADSQGDIKSTVESAVEPSTGSEEHLSGEPIAVVERQHIAVEPLRTEKAAAKPTGSSGADHSGGSRVDGGHDAVGLATDEFTSKPGLGTTANAKLDEQPTIEPAATNPRAATSTLSQNSVTDYMDAESAIIGQSVTESAETETFKGRIAPDALLYEPHGPAWGDGSGPSLPSVQSGDDESDFVS
jgi:hypothetical protein